MLARPIALAALPLLLAAACSTAPEQPEEVTEKKNRAAEYTEYGNEQYNQGNYATALTFFRQALAYNVSVDNEKGIVESRNSLGKVYLALGQEDDALTSFRAALELAEALEDAALIARCSSNLGELYIRGERYDLAGEALARALENTDTSRSTSDLAILYHNLGMVAKKSDDLSGAMEHFTRALRINTELKLYQEMASNHYMIASLYSKGQEYAKALEHAGTALQYDKRVENSPGIAQDLLALGIISLRSSDREKAYAYFKRSHQVYLGLGDESGIGTLLTYLINTGEMLGRTDEVQSYRQQKERLSAE